GGEGMHGERHAERMETHFKTMDADGDGAVTLAEMQAAAKDRPMHGERAGGKHDGKDRGDRFARLDTDSDGRISKAEFLAASDKMFARMDKNSDGKIERDEIRGGHGMKSKSE
ncbi:MAG: EF-hand domain-containing protein, partial [Parvibaculum sp.]|nr:EF-hand domain-containing protein [Parvibaculum sp.]